LFNWIFQSSECLCFERKYTKLGKKMPTHFSDICQNVLLTGATGFVGKLLVKALIADGQRVTVLTRNAKKAAWGFGGKVKCVEAMEELAADYPLDTIINLAGRAF